VAGTLPVITREGTDVTPDFGQPHASESIAVPVRVGGKSVAVVMAERDADQGPWVPELLKLLANTAQLKLELDLVRRRVRALTVAAREPKETEADAPGERPAAEAPPAPKEEAPASLAPVPERRPSEPGDARRKEARTYAKLVATDIRLYNEEAVLLGRRHRDLENRLSDQLERGRESFRRRFPDLGQDGLGLLEEAYVQVLAAGDPALLSAPTPPPAPPE
jgi:hypothetical protein